jgi:NAD(P)-dependent dehydrogenase (short-subunit alcohol dehydrogenase family)
MAGLVPAIHVLAPGKETVDARHKAGHDAVKKGRAMSEKELTGRVVIVTGAGRNIGRGIALELAAAGAAVMVNVRSNRAEAEAVVKQIEADGGRGLVAIGDVVDPAAVEAMVQATLKSFGRVDYLVNNAALRHDGPFEKMSFDEWRMITGTILDGAFHCVKACMSHLKASGAGSIINVGGLSGHTGAKGRAHVCAGKMGLIGLTRALAYELAPHQVTVNTLVPGMMAEWVDGQWDTRIREHPLFRPILGRTALPEDMATTARFLVGPGARYITGQTINVNGGSYFG